MNKLKNTKFIDSLLISSALWSFTASAGISSDDRFTFNVEQGTHFQEKLVDAFKDDYKHIKSYLDQRTKALSFSFKNILSNEVYGPNGLVSLSEKNLSNPTKVSEFLGRVRKYNLAKSEFLAELNELENLPKYLTESMDLNDLKSKISAPLNRGSRPLVEFYTQEINQLDAMLEGLSFVIKLPNGNIHKQQGLDTSEIAEKGLYSAEQLSAMRLQASRLLIMKTADKRIVDGGINQYTLSNVQNFIQVFGKEQSRRFESNQKGYKSALDQLAEAFWVRSYIRAVYGMKIGSFGVHYDKKKWNLDFFSSKTVQFINTPIYSDVDLTTFQDRIYNALAQQNSARMKDLRLWGVLTTVAGFAYEIQSMWNGDVDERVANELILKLLLSDIEEEKMLSRAGGLKDLRAHYRAKYYRTAETEEYYKELAERYLPSEAGKEDIEADVLTIDAGTLVGVFNQAVMALENQEDRINEAKNILATIETFSSDNADRQRRKLRQRI